MKQMVKVVCCLTLAVVIAVMTGCKEYSKISGTIPLEGGSVIQWQAQADENGNIKPGSQRMKLKLRPAEATSAAKAATAPTAPALPETTTTTSVTLAPELP